MKEGIRRFRRLTQISEETVASVFSLRAFVPSCLRVNFLPPRQHASLQRQNDPLFSHFFAQVRLRMSYSSWFQTARKVKDGLLSHTKARRHEGTKGLRYLESDQPSPISGGPAKYGIVPTRKERQQNDYSIARWRSPFLQRSHCSLLFCRVRYFFNTRLVGYQKDSLGYEEKWQQLPSPVC